MQHSATPKSFPPSPAPGDRSLRSIVARLAALALAPMFSGVKETSNDVMGLELRSADDMAHVAPGICKRLKSFYSQRPRPWRTWRGSRSAAQRRRA